MVGLGVFLYISKNLANFVSKVPESYFAAFMACLKV